MAQPSQTFEQFMTVVNQHLVRMTGMTASDMTDYCYYDCWKAGDTPKQTAYDALEYAMDY